MVVRAGGREVSGHVIHVIHVIRPRDLTIAHYVILRDRPNSAE